MTEKKQSIGFIGLGVMGRPMATHLLKHGYPVWVYDKNPEAIAPLMEIGARASNNVKDLADQVRLVFTSLPTPAVFSEVMTGVDGIVTGSAVKIAVDLSTVGSRATKAASQALRERGMELVDAPVSGGAAGAVNASLAVMVAGQNQAVHEVLPILQLFGKTTVVGNEAGQAQLLKLLNNMLSATAFAVTAEAFVAGVKGGLDPKVMLDVINISSGRSAASQEKFMRQVLPRSFDFGFPISSVCKDIGLAIEECEALGVPMWVGSQARQLWNFALKQDGLGRDMTELVQYIENWADAVAPKEVKPS
jgi:2-hydroxy-3-oxopropionate reductase